MTSGLATLIASPICHHDSSVDTGKRFNSGEVDRDNQTHRRVMYSKRQYIYINSFDWLCSLAYASPLDKGK